MPGALSGVVGVVSWAFVLEHSSVDQLGLLLRLFCSFTFVRSISWEYLMSWEGSKTENRAS